MAAGDLLYRKLLAATRFFSRGWGPVSTYERLLKINSTVVDRSQCAALLADHLHPIKIKQVRTLPEGVVYDGKFDSPLTTLFPGMLPRESEVASRTQARGMGRDTLKSKEFTIALLVCGRVGWMFGGVAHSLEKVELATDHDHGVTERSTSGSLGNVPRVQKATPQLYRWNVPLLHTIYPTSRFEMLLPHVWKVQAKPVYIHLAGTGDHYFWRRRHLLALPTLKEANMGAVLLENPYYGSRKPREQTRSQLHHVSDLFVMGLALILECMLLLHWLEKQGLGPVGLTGISMGGHNCSLAASVWPKPVAVVPCLSWATASCVFTEGVLSDAVCWDTLEEQLFYSRIGHDEQRRELFKSVVKKYSQEAITGTNTYSDDREAMDPNSATPSEKDGERVHVGSKRAVSRHKRKQLKLHPETIATMNSILDFATHLSNFPTPLTPDLACFLAAKDDCYIPRQNVTDVRSIWPGCEVRYIEGGHVSACLLEHSKFRRALVDAMDKVLGGVTAPA